MTSTTTHLNPLRRLGRDGPLIPALGYGAMGLSAFYANERSDDDNREVLKKVVELGQRHIDTSILYGPPNGKNERLIGSLLSDKSFRDKVFIATKFGLYFDENGGLGLTGKPTEIRKWSTESLKNLQVDSIDLYYQHRVDRSIPIEETWGELKKLKEEGKVKYLGISEATSEEIRKAHSITPISALQIEFSPWTPDIKFNGILDTCRELGIAIVAYSPLGRGFLTGSIKSPSDFGPGDYRATLPRFQGEAFKENLKLVDALKELANKKGVTPGQLTLAWVLAQGDDFFAIPGTTRIENLEENNGALKIVLTPEDIKAIDDIVAKVKTVGGRYDPSSVSFGAF